MLKVEELINTVICADCLDIMRQLPDKCISLCLCDPPYGIGESNEKNARRGDICSVTNYGSYSWDKGKISDEYIIEIKRISKNQIIFGGNYYGSILGDTSCYIVWDKDNGCNDFADCELAWTSFKTAVRKFKYRWNGMLQENMRDKEKRIHPTQKPVALFEWILKLYSKPGDIILDPFLGSGTTVAACINLERQYIGIEISPDYVFAAEQRIKKATEQRRMFL
jgi:site-specific DNA-methyltransferase (adenine-specific)